MQSCIQYAKANAYEILWLGVWEKNPKAISFYTKEGFKHFGEHDFLLGDDVQKDHLLKLDLI
jgi:ribosomal protein S18 acetylase RimI-like enzyme